MDVCDPKLLTFTHAIPRLRGDPPAGSFLWVPACAGMTDCGEREVLDEEAGCYKATFGPRRPQCNLAPPRAF